jgi:23S rRNA pseudouridine955/2504/2580 synthase
LFSLPRVRDARYSSSIAAFGERLNRCEMCCSVPRILARGGQSTSRRKARRPETSLALRDPAVSRVQSPLQIDTQIRPSIFKMSELRKESVNFRSIDDDDAGQRLDNFLLRICKGVPKSHIYRIVRNGEVRINGKRAEVSYRLSSGDQVRIPPIRLAAGRDEQKNQEIAGKANKLIFKILYEDDALLAINKDAGIAVHGGSGVDLGVIEALRIQRPESRFLELAHRLDRETSGVLLIGKRRSALRGLHSVFREGRADKRYLALVSGSWQEKFLDVRLPLYKFLTAEGERRVAVNEDEGQTAHTIFRRVSAGSRFSLLEAQLKTGRTHQIRVHLAHLKHPITGDEKYGDFALNRLLLREGLKRMFLHAREISFAHPLTGDKIRIAADLPPELSRFVEFLRNKGDLEHGAPL